MNSWGSSVIVNITDYGDRNDSKFIEYTVSGLSDGQIEYLRVNLDEEILINEGLMILTMYFDDKFYPFQSDAAKIRLDDFISREEIEMTIFLSGFLEDI